MIGSYNPFLVTLSLAVAVLASYTLLDVAGRIRGMAVRGWRRRWRLLIGAFAIGNGIWAMHFIGMLACWMPLGMGYDPALTGLSLLLAVGIAYLALHLMTQGKMGLRPIGLGGLLMGLGIVAMHYVGMGAMLVRPAIRYEPKRLMLSVAIALVAAWAALWIAFMLRKGSARTAELQKGAASVVMGLAIAGMHYVGMSAMIVSPTTMAVGTGGIGRATLVGLVSVLAVGGLGLTLGLSLLDGRFDRLLQAATLRLEEAARIREATFQLDTVTGSVTRGSLLERMECAIVQAEREGTLLGLMFLDLDGFKTVNDSLGFAAGDELLKAFFEDLMGRVRPETLVGRLSGDEFVVLLDGFHAAEEVARTTQSIFDRMQRSFHIQGLPLRVTASAGIAIYPQDGATADGLLKSVTLAVHEAKRKGKNNCRFFDARMGAAAGKMLEINRSLGEALEKGQFSLVFQPKFDGRTGRIKGAEALLRWFHPVLGNVSPMDFVPVAEETGQIVAISEWVIADVCRQMNGWKSRGLPELRIAINLSPEQLEEERYAERISDMVAEAGIEASSILFEITETAAMKDPKQAGEVIREFQRAGFEFAIDDFGTGYSSLAYLQQFRAKELKIDRCFVKGMDEGAAEGSTIVSAIITLAHALQMKVVAEGVETVEQLQMLKAMGCDEVQGYLLARPLKPEDFEALVVAEARALEAERGLAEGRGAGLRAALA